MREALLDVKEVSGLLSVHPKTVYLWKSTGRIPSVSVNGLVRFEQRQIDEFLERRRERFVDPGALLPKAGLSLEAYDKLRLKGESALSKKAGRWNYGFGTVFIRKTEGGPDHWHIEYRHEGKRIRESVRDATSREGALIVLQSKVAGIANGRMSRQPTAELMPFGIFAEKFLNEYAKSEKTSWKTDEYKLRVLRKFFENVQTGSITELMIREFREIRLRAGIEKTTANRYLALLKKMFNWAISRGILSFNPVKGIKMFSESDRVRDRVLRADEEARLFAELTPKARPVVLLLLHTGLRYREGLNLTWDNVDLQRRRIKVEKTKSKRARIVPINSLLLEALEELRGKASGPRLFAVTSLKNGFNAACKRAGLANFKFHDLRRTFGTRLLEHGVDIVTISKLYGHSSVLVTQRYLHPDDDLSVEAVEYLAGDAIKARLSQGGHKKGASVVAVPVSDSLRAS